MEDKDIEKLITQLRDDPVDNTGATDEILARLYTHLLTTPRDQQRKLHWFCSRADSTTVGIASFLLRLFAYDGNEAETWRGNLHVCLSGCCNCVAELITIRSTSRTTYFAKFSPEILDGFWAGFDAWDVKQILGEFEKLGITPGNPGSVIHSLSDVPSPLALRVISNWAAFSDERVQNIIHSIPPNTVFQDWPTTIIPPGVLALLMEQTPAMRQWATVQASRYRSNCLFAENFTGDYVSALRLIVYGLTFRDFSNLPSEQFSSFRFAPDILDLWVGFRTALRFLPVRYLGTNNKCVVDVRKVISGHLSDTGAHFVEVLHCFNFLLKRLEASFWAGELPEHPLVVFDTVKNNVTFGKLLQGFQGDKLQEEKSGLLAWVHEFFHCVQDMDQIHETVVIKISDFLLGELQHERFGGSRSHALDSAARLFSTILSKSRTQPDSESMKVLFAAVDLHVDILIRVAFHRDYDSPQWSKARVSWRHFLDGILLQDVQQTLAVIAETCRLMGHVALKKPLGKIPKLSALTSLWPKIYQSIHCQDLDGFSSILSLVSEASHIDTFNKKNFELILPLTDLGDEYANGDSVVTTINSTLSLMRTGFRGGIKNVVDYTTCSQLSSVLYYQKVGKAVTLLLLSPVDDFHTTAKTLIGQTFDVDGRLECIRTLLEKLPDSAIDGLLEFLKNFCTYAPTVPEACSLSKSLVRCFTDVIDALCSKPDGLLHDSQFIRCNDPSGPASRMIELWILMSKALAVIFKRTPAWSSYFDNAEMIEWMRDALIFGRDMLAQWQVIESVAIIFLQHQPRQGKGEGNASIDRVSTIGPKMISCFQDVLTELTRWLRLTDEELLHQSFSLLQSLLDVFRKEGIRPCEAAFTKLTKYVDSARKDVNQTRSRLDTSRITSLEEALSSFSDDDDEIQIISEKIVSKPPVAAKHGEETAARVSTNRKPAIVERELKDAKPHTLDRAKAKQTTSTFLPNRDKEKSERSILSAPGLKKQIKYLAIPPGNQVISQQSNRFKNEATSSAHPDDESESEESESDDEASSGGLASLAKKFARSPKIKKPIERRQVKALNIASRENPAILRMKQREEAYKARMRMKPNVSDLHRVLLTWNYDHDGLTPPGFDTELRPVPDNFTDFAHFHRTFEPLLLLECWAQILQAKDEKQEIYECKLSGKSYVDDWLELDVVFEANLRKDFYLTEADIVLLRQPQTSKCILAKTKSFSSNFHATQASLRCYIKKGVEDPGLRISTLWKINKVFSLSTLHREYAALKSLPYYDYGDAILRPRLKRVPSPGKLEIQKTMADFKINEPQATAILAGMKAEGFTLIQGPPGTGKTSTICGLVSLALGRRSRPVVPIQAGNSAPHERTPLPKILLCAPSNAAIDEIARRIKDGFRGPEKRGDIVKVVRIGAEQSMNNSVRDISLDNLVDQAIDAPKDTSSSGEIGAVRKELDEIRAKKDRLSKELDENSDPVRLSVIQSEIAQLNTRRTSLAGRLDRLKDDQKSASRTLDALRRSARLRVLLDADVICSTLSGAGHEIIEQLDFDMIVIDEAAQAIELSTLIPLKYKCQRCVLVGDPQQLPPTVLSQEAARYRYNQSLFVRMQKSEPEAVHLLSIQYRMHPTISQLPSMVFYQGRLKDGPEMDVKTTQPWHTNPRFGSYKFFNVLKGLEESSGRSIKNLAECQIATNLYHQLQVEYSKINLDFRIGVVSMYKAQITELKRQFEQRFGKDILGRIDFNTVDGFQGQEKDIIILSCVRSGPGLQKIGFLSDIRRMNVALTRAKSSLFILGNSATLERSDEIWRAIVRDARQRSFLVDVDLNYFTRPLPVAKPIGNAKTKATKPAEVASVPPVPDNLFRPGDHGQSGSGSVHLITANPRDTSKVNLAEDLSQVAGAKRPNEESSSSGKLENGRQLIQPPMKRPKKAPNIFIPKNKKS